MESRWKKHQPVSVSVSFSLNDGPSKQNSLYYRSWYILINLDTIWGGHEAGVTLQGRFTQITGISRLSMSGQTTRQTTSHGECEVCSTSFYHQSSLNPHHQFFRTTMIPIFHQSLFSPGPEKDPTSSFCLAVEPRRWMLWRGQIWQAPRPQAPPRSFWSNVGRLGDREMPRLCPEGALGTGQMLVFYGVLSYVARLCMSE